MARSLRHRLREGRGGMDDGDTPRLEEATEEGKSGKNEKREAQTGDPISRKLKGLRRRKGGAS